MTKFLSVILDEPLETGKEMLADPFLGSSIYLTSSYLGMCCLFACVTESSVIADLHMVVCWKN